MTLPTLDGIIDRRILINFRVDPAVVQPLLPSHLEPLVINGYASAGICLLRLRNIGLKYTPSFLRITSENAAHRFLVKKTQSGQCTSAVYIPRRDTDSNLNVVFAGKLFSWPHYKANFNVTEGAGKYNVAMDSGDGNSSLKVSATLSDSFPSDSMFDSMSHASSCFKDCSLGISPSLSAGSFKSIELRTQSWSVRSLDVESLHSAFFENESIFPIGSIRFDNALLMEGIQHEWRSY
jgi:hypothetical protein